MEQKKYPKSFVYVIQNKHSLLIYGCFKTRERAEKYINGNIDYSIIKCLVE